MPTITTSIEINKPLQQVSDFFYDFANHATWDPFVQHIKNITAEQESRTTNKPGDTLNVTIVPPQGQKQEFVPIILETSPTIFLWKGTLLSDYVFVGRHKFEFKAIDDNKTIVYQSEDFSGLLATPLLYFVGENTKAGFITLNEALKEQLEKSP
ncbi:hypothetical protein DFJ63DRAFT_333193 [Scheffersomyces coipomensis]|uniref:uncharacterized protein n=1 Tax=Scheffersomyces coipomensis TaxID=1788519 RepID=UPI00315D100B